MTILSTMQARIILQQAHSLPRETVESAIAWVDGLKGKLDKPLEDLLYAAIDTLAHDAHGSI